MNLDKVRVGGYRRSPVTNRMTQGPRVYARGPFLFLSRSFCAVNYCPNCGTMITPSITYTPTVPEQSRPSKTEQVNPAGRSLRDADDYLGVSP